MKSFARVAPSFAPVVLALCVLLATPALLSAQAYGRYILTLENEAGEPLADVTVVATSEEMANFEETVVTDKKGRATFTFVDATKQYVLTIDHEGYTPAQLTVKATIRGVNRQTVALPAAGSEPEPTAQPTAPAAPASLTPAEATFNDGVIALQNDDVATAEAKFKEALEKDPKLDAAYSGLAGLYLAQGNDQAALDTAARLLELKPEDLRGLRITYEAHNRLGNKAEAKAALNQISALGDNSNAASMMYNEGVAALKVGDRVTARERFEEALQTDPALAAAHAGMATIEMGEENYAAAATAAEATLAIDPDNLQALRVRFDAYRLLKDTAKTDAALAALAEKDPDTVFSWLYDTGVELFDGGDMQLAIERLEGALKVRPEDPNVLYRLGLAYVNVDQKAKARQMLDKFLAVSPEHPEAPVAKEMLAYLQQ